MTIHRRDLLRAAGAALVTGLAPLTVFSACTAPSDDAQTLRDPSRAPKAPRPDELPLSSAALQVRPSEARGRVDHGWLDARHSFSFASYQDPNNMGFRSLRVINEDRIQGGRGFPMHGHRDMEIITYLLDGALEHKDSLGGGGVITPGLVQHMSAGSGIRHSEFNPSDLDSTHLLQIWLLPAMKGIQPAYHQRHFGADERKDGLRLVASASGRDGALAIETDADLYASLLSKGRAVTHRNAAGRHAWLQVARGKLHANGHTLKAGDAAATSVEGRLELTALEDAEFLLFDLA